MTFFYSLLSFEKHTSFFFINRKKIKVLKNNFWYFSWLKLKILQRRKTVQASKPRVARFTGKNIFFRLRRTTGSCGETKVDWTKLEKGTTCQTTASWLTTTSWETSTSWEATVSWQTAKWSITLMSW